MSKDVALVLSSGGARGLAHIGAIQELEAQGYRITSVAGCSMGALIAGVYATGKLDTFREWMKTVNKKKMLELTDFSLSINHLVKGNRIIEAIMEFVPDVPIEELPIPYCAVATDWNTGREVVFRKGSLFGIPFPVILFIAVFAIFMFVLEKTTFGRRIYATGSNAVSAKLAGVNIDRTKIAAYAISGCMAALSGLILLSRLSSAQPTLGEGYEMDAIASVALGGTSMSSGRGRIQGTFVGVLIIAVLNNGLNILGVSSYYQSVVKAIVILIAVLSDRKR